MRLGQPPAASLAKGGTQQSQGSEIATLTPFARNDEEKFCSSQSKRLCPNHFLYSHLKPAYTGYCLLLPLL